MKTKGFTLVELVLTMTLISIVVVVTGLLMGRGLDAYRLVTQRTDAVHQARFAIVRIQKELEMLTDVTNAQVERIGFRDPNLNAVDFRLVGSTLYRGSEILAESVTRLAFTYYRDNGNETSSAPQVRRIHMEMTVDAGPAAGSLELRTDVFPRNFIYENFR